MLNFCVVCFQLIHLQAVKRFLFFSPVTFRVLRRNISDETFLHSDSIDCGVYSWLLFFGPVSCLNNSIECKKHSDLQTGIDQGLKFA